MWLAGGLSRVRPRVKSAEHCFTRVALAVKTTGDFGNVFCAAQKYVAKVTCSFCGFPYACAEDLRLKNCMLK